MPKHPALAAALSLLLTACGSGQIALPGSASIDTSFSERQTEVIVSAIDAWRAATHGVAHLDVTIGDGGELHIHPAALDHETLGLTTLHSDDTASMEIDLPNVWTAARVYRVNEDDELQDTVMHELGHAFGLEHVEGTLMRANGYGGGMVDPDTLRRFCEHYTCR